MTKRRISTLSGFLLFASALIVDGVQALVDLLVLIPGIGIVLAFALGVVVDVSACFLFGFWFSHLGLPLLTRYPLGFLGTLVIENIPGLNSLPTWTLFVAKIIAQERIREGTSSDEV
ncbi:hypothetical protein HZC00_01725 [Candidatus Kaiserbacteria bacterium]|nr:hypothetical protein [Candidatus Kaiserbacteria bacterium]